jgi:hypothetical protein
MDTTEVVRRVLEHITLVTPLGLRFWDDVSGTPITDGLIVTAYPRANPVRRMRAFSNRSGLYVLRHLPGLRAVEHGEGDQSFWDNLPDRQPFIVEVVDIERRFLPMLFPVDLPVRDVFIWEDPMGGSPLGPAPGVPLFSTPNRSVPASMGVLRVTLWDPWAGTDGAGGPAAWAVLEARLPGGRAVRGIADAQGRVALILPYPEPVGDGFGVSPGTGASLRQQEWTLELQAFYMPVPPVLPIPNLHDTLMQPPATLWTDSAYTYPLTEVPLQFGQPLIVRSRNLSEGSQLSVLLITPAGSPP